MKRKHIVREAHVRKGELDFSVYILACLLLLFVISLIQIIAIVRQVGLLENMLEVNVNLDDQSSSLVSLVGAHKGGMLYMEMLGDKAAKGYEDNVPDMGEIKDTMDDMNKQFKLDLLTGTTVSSPPMMTTNTASTVGSTPTVANVDKNILLGLASPPPGNLNRDELQPDVQKAFDNMVQDAAKAGYSINLVSGYRSYSDQMGNIEPIIDDTNLRSKILTTRSIPGTSRHHWGTDLDWGCPGHTSLIDIDYSPGGVCAGAYQWMVENACKYGFFQPYTATGRSGGYDEEKWHWSYKPISDGYLEAYNQQVTGSDLESELNGKIQDASKREMLIQYVKGVAGSFDGVISGWVNNINKKYFSQCSNPLSTSITTAPTTVVQPSGSSGPVCVPIPIDGVCGTEDAGGVVFSLPVDGAVVSSGFGYRVVEGIHYCDCHSGVDIVSSLEGYGAPIKAAADGVVTYSGWYNGYGQAVVIYHKQYGYSTLYGHMVENSPTVKSGDKVSSGQVIGNMGNTGIGTGYHVHFVVLKGNSQPSYGKTSTNPCVFFNPAPKGCVHDDVQSCVDMGRENCGSTIAGTYSTSSVSIPKAIKDLLWLSEGPKPSEYITEVPLPGAQPSYIKGVMGGMK